MPMPDRFWRPALLVVWALSVAVVIGLVASVPDSGHDIGPELTAPETRPEAGQEAPAEVIPDDVVEATVTDIVDGDTIHVEIVEGADARVRLLNIDAPEVEREGQPGECLGAEAAQHLRDLLPRGTSVELVYDTVRSDEFGRDLAVVLTNGTNVNAAMVRAGLARAAFFGDNRSHLPEMEAAEREAAATGAGLHGDTCR